MVRLMLVRHAESMQNEYMEKVLGKVRTGEIRLEDFNKAMRDGPKGAAAGDDSPLTSKGHSQAKKFGFSWSKVLREKARTGKLIVFVSPFLRTLQTADPMLQELSKEFHGFSAVLLPHIMEAGGLAHKDDFQQMDEISKLMKAGKRDKAVELLKSIQWRAQGLSVTQINKMFPWAKVAEEKDLEILGEKLYKELPLDSPWWKSGYETSKRTTKRVREVIEWLLKTVAKNETGATGDDVVVLMFSHGQTIAQICNALSHHAFTRNAQENDGMSFDGIRNTSMTCVFLPSQTYPYSHERPNSNGERIRYSCRLEFFNDTTHLGVEKLEEFGNTYLGAKL
mmetsp:Transcript_3679/g.4106  ORF Transcript_3679/g.4106 Transcript_3679/m.4106 type:complete len:337 (-) Transcript_3679:863-1873(-)